MLSGCTKLAELAHQQNSGYTLAFLAQIRGFNLRICGIFCMGIYIISIINWPEDPSVLVLLCAILSSLMYCSYD